jgi:IS5 family transposase
MKNEASSMYNCWCPARQTNNDKEEALRAKALRQEYLDFSRQSTLKVVEEYRSRYLAISDVLDSNPKILSMAHLDFSRNLSQSSKGRGGDYTSEQILRSIVVMFLEGAGYRDAVVMVENSEFLQGFVKLGPQSMMDFTFLCKAFSALSDKTWKAMNELLGGYAKEKEKITGEKVRLDTTAYETNIHYPTDSSLLWDSFRTQSRLLGEIRQQMRVEGMDHRFHNKKAKKLMLYISRNARSKSNSKKRKVKSTYRTLIERVRWITAISRRAMKTLATHDPLVMSVVSELSCYVPIVERIIDQAERRVIGGETVPATEKVYSLFEEHTELIKRGKARSPVEFGHKVLVAQTTEKFIHHYETFRWQQADKDLLDETLSAHERLFGDSPKVLAADKGFYDSRDQIEKLSKDIPMVSICKKGRRNAAEIKRESAEEFKAGQRFRAGSEGTISVLKRAFKLNRCLFKGFKNYAASVGCAVFCHNLVLLARL